MKVLTARCVLPVTGAPVLKGGAVAVEDGVIRAAGRTRDVLKLAGAEPEVHDLGDAVLMPGVVNAHTHLDLAWFGGNRPPGGDFIGWVEDFEQRVAESDEDTARSAAGEALDLMVSRGTAAVGDVTRSTWTVPLLARSGLLATLFLELRGMDTSEAESILQQAAEWIDAMERARDDAGAGDRIRIVLSPHGANTTSGALLKALAGRASATASSLSIHVSESPGELTLLQDGTGDLADALRRCGVLGEGWTAPGHSPVEYLDRLGVLSHRTLAAHCVHLNRQELSRLQAREVAVIACPRSNAYTGAGTAPIPLILSSGIPVALGTESLASSPDPDIFGEMAALREDHPALAPAAVLRMATLNGARVLGLHDRIGSLEPGKAARIVAVPLPSPQDDPLEVVTTNPERVSFVEI